MDEAWFHLSGYIYLKTAENGVLKSHVHYVEILCICQIGFLCTVSQKLIVGPLFFNDIEGAEIFSISCNYTLFIAFLIF
jgi:hypothetical protein